MEATLPIVRELTTVGESLMWIVGPGEMVSENTSRGIQEPEVSGSSITIKADNWHFHLDQGKVGGIQFVETHGDLSSYYVRFADHQGETLLRAYMPRPQSGNSEATLSKENPAFESMKERYQGVEGIEYVRREVRYEPSSQSTARET
jgi:putative heme iron utilization protein